MTAQLGVGGGFIPKGAKNVEVAKDFMKYVIQPKVVNDYLKSGLGRWLPAMPSLVKSDPCWLDNPKDPHRSRLCKGGRAEADDGSLLRLQPGVGPGVSPSSSGAMRTPMSSRAA